MDSESAQGGAEFLVRDDLYGWPVLDRTGQRRGRVYQIHEDAIGRTRYLGVRRGLLGPATLIPADLVELDPEAEEVRTPWAKEELDGAPAYDGDTPIDTALQTALYAHFGRPSAAGGGEGEMVCSEEELRITTREVPYGVARLRKRVELEPVEERVVLSAEFVEIDEEEVPDPDLDPGTVLTTPEGDLSVPVVAERLVVRKEPVVVKRVILRRRTRQVREEIVSDVLRRERVEVEVDPLGQRRAGEAGTSGGEGEEPLPRAHTGDQASARRARRRARHHRGADPGDPPGQATRRRAGRGGG